MDAADTKTTMNNRTLDNALFMLPFSRAPDCRLGASKDKGLDTYDNLGCGDVQVGERLIIEVRDIPSSRHGLILPAQQPNVAFWPRVLKKAFEGLGRA
jgi:hypothetical protein